MGNRQTRQDTNSSSPTHQGVSTFERYPGGEALVSALVTVDIYNAQGPISCSLRTDLHDAQVPAAVFRHQARPHGTAWKSRKIRLG